MFYGRNYYINLLEELLKKPMSSVVTCRGRRRVGKADGLGGRLDKDAEVADFEDGTH